MNFIHGGNVFAVARLLGVPPEAILDFSASINPLGPPPGVRTAVATAFDRLGHYPDSACTELTAALADHHGCEPSNVCIGNGSTELIYLLPRLVAGRRALIIAPTFSEYAVALRHAGWEYDWLVLPSDAGFPLALAAVRKELKKGYGLLFLCNPGNPTGRLYGQEEVAELLDICREAGTLPVVDEAFMDFCEEASVKRHVIESGAGVVLRSMTKFYGFPGLRLGYALAAPSLTERLVTLRLPWGVSTLAQAAGLAALADNTHAGRSRAFVAEERTFLMNGLCDLPGVRLWPGAANYVLARLDGGMTAAGLQGRLLPERILIRDCGNFHGLDGHFFRVAVRTREENERLLAALGHALEQMK
ncbi:MAG TPA: threonine-phosphate decarboxylase CobD [Geobacteraceae bacterium]|nr:threonine-phosphate decarboxylase CobD [Geobacteraceae bacterium]